MNRGPYHTYHGRKSLLRRILIAIIILLVIALAAAVVGLFVLPNYIVYTADGPQLVLPLMGGKPSRPTADPSAAVTQTDQPSVAPTDIVFEAPSPSAAPSAAPTTLDAGELPQRRRAPLGLIPYQQGKTAGSRQGFIFTAAQTEDFAATTAQEEYGYVAVYVDAQELSDAQLAEQCLKLVKLGVDELVVDGQADWAALRRVLPSEVYHGYLSAVAEKTPFQNDTQQGRDMAQYCDRVYVPGGNWNGFNLNRYLKENGFVGTTADVVTMTSRVLDVNYAWAILPT